jgi:hypothetical protein
MTNPKDDFNVRERSWRISRPASRVLSRQRPLSSANRVRSQQPELGPYETRYDIREGYEAGRTVIRP